MARLRILGGLDAVLSVERMQKAQQFSEPRIGVRVQGIGGLDAEGLCREPGGYLHPGIGVSGAIAIGASGARLSVLWMQNIGVSDAGRFKKPN